MAQFTHRTTTNTRREVFPSEREVLLSRLLLLLIDEVGCSEALDVDLYNEVKYIAEPIVRGDA